MKNKFLILPVLFCSIFSQAQTNTFPASGNVGIGTLTPLTALDVRDGNILVKNMTNQTNESVIMIDHSLGFGSYKNFGTSLRTFTEDAGYNTYALQFFTQSSYLTGQTEKFRISGDGNVGIGITHPTERLQVNGNIKWGGFNNFMYSGQDGLGGWFEQISNVADENKIRFQTSRSGDAANYAQLFIDATNGFSFRTIGNANGNVGIGIANPTEKLSVNGKIRAHEIKVEAANWPDYVFDQDYKILGLNELDAYIKQHKHLPDIPSSKEAETNGIELGEMNKLLLKKLEELTLHLISQGREIEALKAKVNKP